MDTAFTFSQVKVHEPAAGLLLANQFPDAFGCARYIGQAQGEAILACFSQRLTGEVTNLGCAFLEVARA
jgi:hypothetical protein